jgi:hypothetical protein
MEPNRQEAEWHREKVLLEINPTSLSPQPVMKVGIKPTITLVT